MEVHRRFAPIVEIPFAFFIVRTKGRDIHGNGRPTVLCIDDFSLCIGKIPILAYAGDESLLGVGQLVERGMWKTSITCRFVCLKGGEQHNVRVQCSQPQGSSRIIGRIHRMHTYHHITEGKPALQLVK
ncbi:hypothetical protein SDC9_132043 [bioreactor metagenome]|uniref:Uncharacterized protein n=1 Tax=bioreactor metagenome TaxID=1076179 RepID=A0A645D715_9ZZZZ